MTYQISPTHIGSTGPSALTVPLQPAWTIDLGGPVSYPVMGGYIYVTVTNPATLHPNLYAIDYRTGAIAWGPIDLGGSYWANAAYDNGFVFTVNSTGQMQAFDEQTGAVQWTSQLPGQSMFTSPPAGSYFATRADLIYTSGAGSGGTLYAVHESTGALAWQASVMNGDHSGPVVTRSGVYVSYACAQTYDFEPLHGSLLWHHTSTCEGGGGKTAALYNGKLYVRDSIVGNTVLDASTGATLGTFSATTAPAFSGSTAFFLNGSTLQGVDLGTNAVLWSFTGDGSLSTAPIVVNGNVFIGSTEGDIYAVDTATGSQTWSAHLNSPISGPDEQNASQPLTGLSAGAGLLAVPAGHTLTLFGSALQVTPGNIDFGIHPLGSSTSAPVWLHDNFGGSVTISSITASGDYTVSYGACPSVPAGGDCGFSVTFTPTAYGQRNGTLTISDNAAGGPHTVALTGASSDGVVDHLVLNPSVATMVAGGSQAYEADGYDAYGNYVGNYTATTTFTSPSGSCVGNLCSATKAGSQPVSGLYGTSATRYAYGAATLNVTPGPLDHISVAPDSGVSIAAGAAQTYTTEGFDQYGNDLGSATAATTFSISPDGSCTGAGCTATVAGSHSVTAIDSSKTATASLTVTPGPMASLSLSPASATITAGGSQAYTATGSDEYGNSVGDVTAGTTLTIMPADGSCNQATHICTATATGPHTVTGSSAGATSATATLNVTGAALDHITLSPATASISAGASQSYTTEAFDQYGNDLGSATGATTFSLSPDGSCATATCTATIPGTHTVTATDNGKTASASMTVTPAALDRMTLSPAAVTLASPASQTYVAEGFDRYGNALGDVTASTHFTVSPDGTCGGSTCAPYIAGPHTVTGTNAGVTATASLTVTPGPVAKITISPATATIIAGASQTYQAEGYDQAGNDAGDVTGATSFSLGGNACSGNVCGTIKTGTYQVVGVYPGISGAATATLTVQGAALDHITLTPANATILAGGSQTYVVNGFDSYGNNLGDMTAIAAFTITPDGTCNAGSCSATVVGNHSVVAIVNKNYPANATLYVKPGALDHITLSPASATIVAGGSQAYTVQGFDSYGNAVGINSFAIAIAPDGSCTNGCSATKAGPHTVTAAAGGKSATASLTVSAGPLASLTVSPATATLVVQQSQVFAASGADAYGNAVTIATPAWSVSSGTPGSISPTTGLTTTFKASDSNTGTGSVNAAVNGIIGSAPVTVIPAAPTNLTATVKNAKVNLTWHASAGDKIYAVYRGTTSSNLVLIKATVISTSLTDTPGDGSFYYYVTGVGSTGLQSAPSNTISATVQ
jgi:outer membrane protein assembly factor BamB